MTNSSNDNNFPTYEELYNWLLESYSDGYANSYYKQISAKRGAKALQNMQLPIRERFIHWYLTGELKDDLQIREFKLSDYIKRGFSIPDSFIEFNGLYGSPNNYFHLRNLY